MHRYVSWINGSIRTTAHLPLPEPSINPNLSLVDCCWPRGGVGVQISDTDIDPLFLSLVKTFKTSLASSSARPRHLGTLC